MPAFHNNLVHFKNKSFKGRAPLLSFSDNGSDSSSSEGDDKDNEVGNFGVGEGGWDGEDELDVGGRLPNEV